MSKRVEPNEPKMNESEEATRYTKGGVRPDSNGPDMGTTGMESEATIQGEVAFDGGKLPGNHDDFKGELHERPPVPGADKQHHPAHAMNKGETKHRGV
jgi:hypothetical protein